jgi:hypothetical protein
LQFLASQVTSRRTELGVPYPYMYAGKLRLAQKRVLTFYTRTIRGRKRSKEEIIQLLSKSSPEHFGNLP